MTGTPTGPLAGRSAVVTGSTAGLGYSVAEALAAAGSAVMLNGLAPAAEAEAARAELAGRHGVPVLFHPADLSRPAEIAAMMAAADDAFGAVDIVVNNAVVRNFAPIDQLAPERWDHSLAVNLSAAFHTIRLALPAMKARNFGRIVNMASVFSFFAAPDRVDYVTTKTALLGLTRATAIELAEYDITCNALCPGSTHTPAIEARIQAMAAAEGIPREQAVKRFLATRQPGGRFIEAADVAALAAFLCGPHGRDINGAALPIDAGWTVS